MTTMTRHYCDICDDEIMFHDQGHGIIIPTPDPCDERDVRIVFINVADAEHHICLRCYDSIRVAENKDKK